MGEMADMALDECFDDDEEFHRMKSRGASNTELFDAGFLNEDGSSDRGEWMDDDED